MKHKPARKRGRPRAKIDQGVVFHMAVDGTPRKIIAKHFGVCLDTIMVNCRDVIAEAREIIRQKWRDAVEERRRQHQIEQGKRY